jgi:hypothetical protein
LPPARRRQPPARCGRPVASVRPGDPRELGCSVHTVRVRLREAGIHVLADPARDAEIARRRAAGQTFVEIGAAVGMTKGGVVKAVRRVGASASDGA